MKHLKLISIFALGSLAASAAVPLRWKVETSRAVPAQFEAYQGETLALEAALQSYGKPLEAPLNYSLYWQTNGMGSTYWSVPCIRTFEHSEHSNILYATWSPTNDVGARVYNCFIGQPGTIYHAAFQLRLRPSPGATPNVLPLPVPVIDFAKVRVLNPPWSGGGGGVNTNAVIDIIHKTVDGAARPLTKYLHLYNADDSYPDAAQEYYRSRGNGRTDGGCSSVRDGGFLYRNFDYPFDDRAEFVVKMSAGKDRFASVGVAQVGTNLTEQMVTSGKWLKWYKALPGATVDGINENGVACNINVVDGNPQTSGWHTTGDLHPLAAIRWILDNATNAQQAAEYIAANIRFPQGWTQNFHYMIADAEKTYTVEDGFALGLDWTQTPFPPVMTNFRYFYFRPDSPGIERYQILSGHASITNAWYTNAYRRETNPPWVSDLADVLAYTNEIFDAWATHPKDYFRGKTTNGQPWWQTVHTSIYDLTNRVLRVAVQEADDWYTFQVPSSGAKIDAYTKSETDELLDGKMDSVEAWSFSGDGVNLNFLNNGVVRANYDGTDFVLHGDTTDFLCGPLTTSGDPAHRLSAKADRPVDFDSSHAGNLASLTATGDLADGGIAATNVATKTEVNAKLDAANESGTASLDWTTNDGYLNLTGYGFICNYVGINGDISMNGSVNIAPGEGNDVHIIGDGTNPDHYLSRKADRSMISATDTTFSNAVMSVATGISTNDWAVIASVADWASVIPGGVPTGAGTLGTVLAALAAAVLALKKKTSLLKSDGTAEDDFATNLMGKQVAISAMHYALNSGSTIQDRAINLVTMTDTRQTITLPSRIVGKTRDLILRVEVGDLATIGGIALALGSTELASWEGDALDFAANKNYLVTVTETKNTAETDTQDSPTFFVRVVEMTAQPTAA